MIDGPGLIEQFSSLQAMLDAHRPGATQADPVDPRNAIPVVLLAGFLGAGKSSLLVSLLTNPPDGCRVQAVVNDVGSLPFDPSLIQLRDEVRVELTNGCACCQSSADLGAALNSVFDADLVILEASGLADPHALAHVVHARPRLRLDRIVTVIDATSFDRNMNDPALAPLATRQLEAAHSVIVTKVDRITANDQEHLVTALASRAPGRTISVSTLTDPAIAELLSTAARGARLPLDQAAVTHGVTTLSFDQHRTVSRAHLAAVYASRPNSIVRTKGVVVAGQTSFLLQSTATDHTIEPFRNQHRPAQLTVSGTDPAAIERFAADLGFS